MLWAWRDIESICKLIKKQSFLSRLQVLLLGCDFEDLIFT